MKKTAAIANRKTVLKLALVAVGMFGFGFALAPLYDLFCQVTGLNGKTGRTDAVAVAATPIDTSRRVTVEFTGLASAGLPWEFRPMTRKLEVHPGETVVVKYYVRNMTREPIVGQAIPSVAPSRAAAYFKKIECFCFSNQRLAPGEAKEMPVRFVVMPGLAPDVETLTLSYAFFNTDKAQAARLGGESLPSDGQEHQHHAHAAGNS